MRRKNGHESLYVLPAALLEDHIGLILFAPPDVVIQTAHPPRVYHAYVPRDPQERFDCGREGPL